MRRLTMRSLLSCAILAVHMLPTMVTPDKEAAM